MNPTRTALKWLISAIVIVPGTLGCSEVKMLHIENRWLQVTFDKTSQALTLHSLPSRSEFAAPRFDISALTSATLASVNDNTLGPGRTINLSFIDGRVDHFTLFHDLPFVLIRSSRSNIDSEPELLNHVDGPSLALNLAASPDLLRAFGTAGLTSVDKHSGSYAYLAIANPETRAGAVSGWLTHDRGSGLIFSSIKDGRVHLDARLDYGRLEVPVGTTWESETFALGSFEDARLGLEAWADAIARVYAIKLRPQPVGYCTWYSNPHGRASDEAHLKELSDFAAKQLAPFGFNVVQIDDCWQMGQRRNGPGKNFTTHDPQGPYPAGMKPAAEAITADGFQPGIWLMPFAGDHLDPFFKPHTNWFVSRADGKPYETEWGGTCKDMTHPEAREHLRSVIHRVVHDWGYRYLKLDGLWTGLAAKQVYVNNGYVEDGIGDAVFRDTGKTNIEAFRDGLKLVRREAGPGVFMLGCCVSQNMRSLGGSFGLVDAMRIGPDNGSKWPDLTSGPLHGSRRYFLHGRVWYNDPDPVYVRESMPLNHAQLIGSWVTISGQMNMNSDWLPGLPAERLDLLKRTMPSHGLPSRPVDLFENEIPRIWLLTDNRHQPRKDVIALYNWDDKPAEIECSLDRIGLPPSPSYVGFDYWSNYLIEPMQGHLSLPVPAQSCRVLAVRPAADHPQVISTSRHITQGIVDLLEEHWNPGTRTLSGQSRVVGGDRYELRIVLPGQTWEAAQADVSAEDAKAGVTLSQKQDGELVRVAIESPAGRDVSWNLRFR